MHVNYPKSIIANETGVALMGAGARIDTITLGQIGIFDADTNLSLNAAAAASVRNFFIAQGIDGKGNGTRNDTLKSQGQQIDKDCIKGYTLKCYSPGQSQIVRIQNITRDPECDREWGIKVLYTGNTKLYQLNGWSHVARTYVARTASCPIGSTADSRVLVYDLYSQMLADYENGHVPVKPVLYQEGADIDNIGVIITDFATWLAGAGATATNYVGIQLEVEAEPFMSFCNIPRRYYKLNDFKIDIAPMGDFFTSDGSEWADLNATIKTTQELLYAEGKGYDLKFKEFFNAPYQDGQNHRVGTDVSSGLPLERTFRVKEAGNYSVVNLFYTNKYVAGGQTRERVMSTMIAFEQADNAIMIAFLTVLDALVSNRALADDAANCAGTAIETGSLPVEEEGLEIN